MREVASTFPSFSGHVYRPDDDGFEAARGAWNRCIQHQPELVVRAGSADDVRNAVAYASAQGLPLAVQSTGHGIPHQLTGGVLLDVSDMTGVSVDPKAQTVTLEAGAQWREVAQATDRHGLAPLSGTAWNVGAVGYTLGGGLSLMLRQYGFNADSILSAEVVTADGQLRQVSPTEHPDLFWALKGGGGNFGVVTSLTIRVYPVSRVYNGMIIYPAERSREVIAAWRDWTCAVPDTVTSAAMLVTVPPMPTVPEMLHGKKIVVIRATVSDGDASAIEELKSTLGEPMMDTFGETSYLEAALSGLEPEDPLPAASATALLRDVSEATADRIAALLESELPFIMIDIRHLGGAAGREPEQPSPIGNRDAGFMLATHGIAEDPTIARAIEEESERAFADCGEDLHPGLLTNFISHNSTLEQVRRIYSPAAFARLQEIKRAYDPQNLFRMNHNIPPAGEADAD